MQLLREKVKIGDVYTKQSLYALEGENKDVRVLLTDTQYLSVLRLS